MPADISKIGPPQLPREARGSSHQTNDERGPLGETPGNKRQVCIDSKDQRHYRSGFRGVGLDINEVKDDEAE